MYGLQKIAAARFDEVIKKMPLDKAYEAVKKTFNQAARNIPAYSRTPEQEKMIGLLSISDHVPPARKRMYYQEVLNGYKKPLRDAEKHVDPGYTYEYNKNGKSWQNISKNNRTAVLEGKKGRKTYLALHELGVAHPETDIHVRFGGSELNPEVKSFQAKYYNGHGTKTLKGVTVEGGVYPNNIHNDYAHLIAGNSAYDEFARSGIAPRSYTGVIKAKHIVSDGNHYVIPKENLKHLRNVNKERIPTKIGHPHMGPDKYSQEAAERFV